MNKHNDVTDFYWLGLDLPFLKTIYQNNKLDGRIKWFPETSVSLAKMSKKKERVRERGQMTSKDKISLKGF